MSATPEQIAELCKRLDEPSNWMKEGRANEDWNTLRGTYDKAPFEAAALIRAQAERVRVLEEALSAIVRLSEETDELTELSGKNIIEALINCEQTARAALRGAP